MAIAIVTEVCKLFVEALARWQVDTDQKPETRFLLRDGHYAGNQFHLSGYQGTWLVSKNELNISRGEEWLLTLPVDDLVSMETENENSTVSAPTSTPAEILSLDDHRTGNPTSMPIDSAKLDEGTRNDGSQPKAA